MVGVLLGTAVVGQLGMYLIVLNLFAILNYEIAEI